MRSFRRLSQIGLLLLVACAGGGDDLTPGVPPGRLVVARCMVPPQVPELRTFHVDVLVEDPVGIASVELLFDGQRMLWPGDGQLFVRRSADLTPTRPGSFLVELEVVGVDGVRRRVRDDLVEVTDEPDALASSIEKHAFLERVAMWEHLGLTKDELYERGPQYVPMPDPKLTPIYRNWWLDWMEASGARPFNWLNHCPDAPEVTPYGELLRCWLALNPEVAESIIWVDLNQSNSLPLVAMYPEWTETMKADLDEAFFFAWHWMASSLTFPSPIPTDPSVNQIPHTEQEADVALSREQAWSLYVATVAHSLALEIGGFVPWSILGYHDDDLRVLFHAYSMFEVKARTLSHGTHFAGHWTNGVVHAFPKTTFQFFVDQDIIRATHYDTITELLEWSGSHLAHYTYGSDTEGKTKMQVAFMHWQYYGWQPVKLVLDGTVRENWESFGRWSWTRGCIGTSRMYVSILRALNIPAYWLHGSGVGAEPHLDGHHTPVFPTIGQALSHGDDMLNWSQLKDGVSPPPAHLSIERIYIPWATFEDWFYTHPNHNVGRQKHDEIPIDVLPDSTLDLYCADTAGGGWMALPNTQVYARFAEHYTVQQLLTRGLWARLADKEALLDYCK